MASLDNKRIDPRIVMLALLLFSVIGIGIYLGFQRANDQTVDVGNNTTVDDGDEKIDWERLQTYDIELSEPLTITRSGTYHLTGNLTDGLVTIDAGTNDVRLLLDNVSISNSTGPAVACFSADTLAIELVGENTLSDGKSYNSSYDVDVNGAIYSKVDTVFQGSGTLKLTANYQDAIVGKDDIKIKSGDYIINSADDAIRGKDSVYILGGNFEIHSNADGIKTTNETDLDKGFVLIKGGNIEISAGDDGIKASRELRIDAGTINISKSFEGIEGNVVVINGGDIRISSNDDGVNAGNSSSTAKVDTSCVLSINGGNLYVNSSGDGVDSNGYIYFNGGTVIIDGPTNNGNGPLDSGAGITMNGGKVIAVGSNGMPETLGNTSSVNNISVFFQQRNSAGVSIEIKNSVGDTLLSHVAAKSFSYLAAGSSEFELGEAYTIYLDGEEYQQFVISGITTTIGNNNNIFNNGNNASRR